MKNQENKYFVTELNHINYYGLSSYFLSFQYKKDSVNELDEDKLGKLVDLSGLGTVREVSGNFGEIPQIKEEHFELQRDIYR